MTHRFHDDPTIPPPGHRTGSGTGSILPFLVRSLAVKPQVSAEEDDAQEDSQLELPLPRGGDEGGESRA